MARVYAITGGGGFLGSRLAHAIASGEPGAHVVLFDVAFGSPARDAAAGNPRMTLVQGDVRSRVDLQRMFEGRQVDVVIHCASFGMSGREQVAAPRKIYEVNVGGTRLLLGLCREYNTPSFVFCSTYNAVFAGQPMVAGDDRALPCAVLDEHCDAYSRTKTEAEQLVRRADGTRLRSGGALHTLAIRPAAIYGDGETRHLPRIVSLVDAGLACFSIGGAGVLCDWVYVDNLVHALRLACERVGRLGGRAFFISDGAPVNNFVFLTRLLEASGRRSAALFALSVPTRPMYALAWLIELVHWAVFVASRGAVNFMPLLTRAEVLKVGVTHYASLESARCELGYEPVVDVQTACARTAASLPRPQPSGHWRTYSALLLVGAALALVAAYVFGLILR